MPRFKFWKDSLGIFQRTIALIIGLLGFVSLMKDEFVPQLKDVPIINWLPSWPWYIWIMLLLLFLLGSLMEETYRRYSALEREHERLKKPKFVVLFDPVKDIGPSEMVPQGSEFADRTIFTQCRIRVKTESVEAIKDFDVCCAEFSVLTAEPATYSVILGGGSHPRTLCHGDEMPVGIIREICEKDFYDNVKSKRIEVQAYSRLARGPHKGKEFRVIVRVQGDRTTHVIKSYGFGDRNGSLYFEEIPAPSIPDPEDALRPSAC